MDLEVQQGVPDPSTLIRQTYQILSILPPPLVKACGVDKLVLRGDLGPSREFYPNHGYYVNREVHMNADTYINPDCPKDFYDYHGYFLTRPEQTLYHELAHGFDAEQGQLSLQPEWLSLSGWSPVPKPGLKRLIIREKDVPEVIGEWFYDPDMAEFTRFYASRNPWDDIADSMAFYIGGLRERVPASKASYLNQRLGQYYRTFERSVP